MSLHGRRYLNKIRELPDCSAFEDISTNVAVDEAFPSLNSAFLIEYFDVEGQFAYVVADELVEHMDTRENSLV